MRMITVTQADIDEATTRCFKQNMNVCRNCVIAVAVARTLPEGSLVFTGGGSTEIDVPNKPTEIWVHGKAMRQLINDFDGQKPVQPGDYPMYPNYEELVKSDLERS